MKKFSLLVGAVLAVQTARAHCPLCTIGAAAAAGGAAYLGVEKAVIGLFIGAFAVSTGWWVSRLIKKDYFRYQKLVIILASFLLTVLPLLPIIGENKGLFVPWLGDYGKTFVYNRALVTSIFGGLLVSITPLVSKKISSWRGGKKFPYQGIVITFSLLILAGVFIQVML